MKEIETIIVTVRGQRVILDSDLAVVYGVPTMRLNEQVQRNIDRFPKNSDGIHRAWCHHGGDNWEHLQPLQAPSPEPTRKRIGFDTD